MNTKAQAKKEQLLAELWETRSGILKETAVLSAEKQEMIFLGIWSVKDLLAHVAGWDFTNLDAVKAVLAGELPSFYEHHSRDWQTYNAMLVAKYKRDSLKELFALVEDSQHELIEFLKSVVPENFDKDFGVRFRGYKVTIRRLLEAEIKDEQAHCQQVRDFFKEKR